MEYRKVKKELETSRLIMRSFQMSDCPKCLENFGEDDELGKYIIMFPKKNISEMEAFVSGVIDNPNIWLIEEKSSHEPVGYISVDIPYESLKIGEIGYVLGKKYQHRGYATEAVKKIVDYMFTERKLYMIEAKYNETNISSGKLLKNIGFRTDGILRDRRMDFETGKRDALVVCSITQNEYLLQS